MSAYILRRILLVIPTLIIVTIILFITMRLIPGDVIDTMLGEMGTESMGGVSTGRRWSRSLGWTCPSMFSTGAG